MTTILLIISIASGVTNNCISNMVCKKKLDSAAKVSAFSVGMYATCVIAFGILLLFGTLSPFTLMLGIVFGIATMLGTFNRMRALSCGPMHITYLIITASMIIPTLSGVFFGEGFSFYKLITALVLIGFLYLSLDKRGGVSISGNWFICCVLSFLCSGTVGVLQKIHQSSPYKGEASGFLFIAFIISMVISVFRAGGSIRDKDAVSVKMLLLAAVCGTCIFIQNYFNLKLAGMMPSQLFFPLVNGSAIVMNSLLSITLFKEKLTLKQTIGLVGGIASLITICLVP